MLILARVASAAAPSLLGDITVTELQPDTNRVPQYYGEWFELRNSYAGTLEFDDVTITRSSGDSITIGSVIVASGDYLVLGVSQNTTYGDADFNGNVPVDVLYPFADFNISAAADSLTVAYEGTLLDEVVWDASWGVSVDYAHAASLNAFDLEWANDFSLNWCPSATFITVSGMYGSPGVDNDYCGSSPGVDDDGDGYSEREGDCRDDDASIHPGAVDGTDGVPQSSGGGGNPNDDADCDGVRDNGVVDGDGDGYTETDGDCDDGDASIHPGASDIEGDGIDQNCDGADAVAELDDDGDGYGYSDCDDDDPTINPGATEVCDDADNDCDLLRDEDVKVTWFDDADGDGFGDPSAEHDGCTPPDGSVGNGEDCDDADADRFPGNVEVCDARDNDCDDATYDPLECGDDVTEEDPECGCTTTAGVPWLALVSALAFVRVRRTSLVMFWILACAPEGADTAAPPPDVPPSTCGDTYTFLPTTTMGEVVESEYVEEWSLDVDTLRSVVALGGIGDTSVIQHGVRAWRIRYRTQDRGREVEATALVAVPDTAVDAPSVLYLHPTTGFEDFCAPSGRDLTWAGVPLAFAGIGYAVVAPDYLGQNGFGPEADFLHPYLGAEPTAIASLDALRALWRFSEVDAPSRRTLLLGASQGGGGALWAQRYASAYLPEAELIGNMMSVPVLDLVGMAEQAAAELSVASVGEPFILYTLAEWYGLDLDITEVIPDEQLARVEEAIATDCPSAEVPADITSLEQVYTQSWMDALATGDLAEWDPWSCLLADSSVGSAPVGHTVDVPIFAIFGGADDVSLGDVQLATVDTLCAEGEQVVAWQCEGLGHTDTVIATADAQVAWMSARAAGEPFTGACAGVEVRSCE